MNRFLALLILLLTGPVLAGGFVPLNPDLNQPKISVQQSDLQYTLATIEFPGFSARDSVREGILFQQIVMPKTGITIKEGYPQLPKTVRLVGIDFTGDFRATPVSVEYEEFDDYYLYPAQPQPTRLGEELPWTFNEKVYSTDRWYPEQVVGNESPANLRNYRVLPVVIQPVQFNPVQRKIRVAKRIVFQVQSSGHSGTNEQPNREIAESPAFVPLYQNYILNYNQIRQAYTPGIQGLPDMLIITHDSYYNAVLPFAEWKNQKGVYTKVVKTSEISATPTTYDIKNYIQSYYDNATDKPDYLLIVGDVTGSAAVPWFSVSGSMSDMPYYFLVGNDILADISGGRISVQTPAEATTVFSKLIRYEKYPFMTDPNWFHSVFIINSNDFQDPIAGDWAENQFSQYGYNPIYHIGDNMGNATVANVYNAVNSGISYIYYIGHGAPTYWVTTGFSTSHIPALTNGEMQPVISSVACNNADLDEPNDVFAEVWLKNNVNNGSVGIMAFTESCAVYETDTLARGMVRAVLSDTITAFGNIIDYGRLHMFQSYGTSCSAPMHQSILIGEPELQVWTHTPELLTVNAPQAAFFNIPFTVQVSGSSGPVPGALVCYWDSLGHQTRGYTDANGEILLDHGVAQPVDGWITVSGHNLHPYRTTISILPPQGPYVMVQNLLPTDTTGNNNQIIESGEQFNFSLTLENIGVDPADSVTVTVSSADTNITFLQNTYNFGNLSAGGSTTAGNFEAQISPECPHRHSIPIDFQIQASDTNQWNQQKYLLVRQGARIELPAQPLAFQPTFLNFTSQMDLTVGNTGPDTLWVNDIISNLSQFAVNPVQFFVAPGQQQTIQVNFTPDSTLQYNATFAVLNSDPINYQTSFAAQGTGIYAPQIVTLPDSIQVQALATDSVHRTLTLKNNGLGPLSFSAQVTGYDPNGENIRGSGGTDTYGHIWIDSDEPGGPVFNWIDISSTGSPVSVTGNNSISNSISIGFPFTFYGSDYQSLRVCSNGWLSFTTYSVAFNNVQLPSTLAPRTLIAPLWDDLNMQSNSRVYVENLQNKFVIQFQDIYRVTGEGPYSFEVILFDNGNIQLQYLSLDSLVNDYTVGIQNHDASDGLTVAFNENYAHENLAVLISKHSWLSVSPLAGTIPAQTQMDLNLTIKTHNFPLGDFYAGVQIESNDPAVPILLVPVHLSVGLVDIDEGSQVIPLAVQLTQNFPNPFNPETSIRFALPAAQEVQLTVYNLLGQKVKTLAAGKYQAGLHEMKWDGTNDLGRAVGSGVYVYKLQTPERTIIRKMMFLK